MKVLLFFVAAILAAACSNITGSSIVHFDELDTISIEQLELAVDAAKEISNKTYESDEYMFSCTFIPSIKFLQHQKLTNTELFEAQKEYAKQSSFLLELKVLGYHDEMLKYEMGNLDQYYQRIEYYSFNVNEDIRLITNSDTIVCSQHHFERTYGLAPTIRLNLQFPIPEEQLVANKFITLEFLDRVYEQGIVNFKIEPDHIKRYRLVNSDSYEEN